MKKLTLILITLFISSVGFAEDGYVGGLLGFGLPTESNVDPNITYGIRGGANLEDYSLGLYIQRFSDAGFAITQIMAEGYMNLKNHENFYAGARLGIARDSLGERSESGLGFGGFSGMTFYIKDVDNLTVGPEMSIMFLAPDDSFLMFSLTGAVNYTF